ncbi:ABC transporter permease [Nonomuraea sp. CA-143628]|uniref:ABC transporter permease n=1 Tax=Nonomuraea sp. CA-143628 TaxID=3239997 RepID=UPI003D91CC4D
MNVDVVAPTKPRRRAGRVPLGAGLAGGLIIVITILGPLIAPYDPHATDLLNQGLPPSAQHLLSTDSLGRDILSRILHGARTSLLGPLCVSIFSVMLGTVIAVASAWFGGAVDALSNRALDVLFAFPSILIAIVAVAMFGAGTVAPVVALSISYAPYVARVVRSVVVREVHLPYIEACRLLGYSGLRICLRHLLPNVQGIIVAQATIIFASALMDLAALSFLGLGAQPPSSHWGLMVQEGSVELLNGAPQQSLAAGAAVVLTVVTFNVLGERLNNRFSEVHR